MTDWYHATPKHHQRKKTAAATYTNVNCRHRLLCLELAETDSVLDCSGCVDSESFSPPDHTEIEACRHLVLALFGRPAQLIDSQVRQVPSLHFPSP
jgi:hypothetical protein